MDSREFASVPHIETAVREGICRLLRAGRDFRDLPEQEGRYIVIGRTELRWGNLVCLKKGVEGKIFVFDNNRLTQLSLQDLTSGEIVVLAAALLSHDSH